jgi:opacity protein-like surface antigen
MTSPFHEGNRFDTTVMADFGWRCADNDLEPVDEQHAFGLEADIRLPHDQTGLEVGVFHSYRDGKNNGIDVSSSMTEASVGGRWVYGSPWILGAEPYATGGASLIFLSNETDYGGDASQSATDWTVGPYIRLGLQWTFAEHLTFALDYRQVMFTDWFRDIHLDDLTTDANYSQVGVVLGWKF